MTVASIRQSVRNNVWWGVRLPTVGKRQASNAGPKPTRFVSAAGNDNNDGLTPATAWATIAKVNAATLASNDVVAFRGGDTFTGTITPQRDGTAAASLVFTSYGVGQATISAGGGTAVDGLTATNRSYVTIDNLTFLGDGSTNTDGHGIHVINNQAGDTHLPGILIQYCTVSGFGGNGIWVRGDTGNSGFNAPQVLNCIVYACTFGSWSAGIQIDANGYGNHTCHNAPLVRGCLVYGNLGGSWNGGASGSGIFMGQHTGGLIDNCIAHGNGLNCASIPANGGPVGIWTADCSNPVIQFCESYANSSMNVDGGGFDFDGGTINGVIQYCYSHDNGGAGFMLYGYNDGTVTTFSGNTVRFCISANDGQASYGPNTGMYLPSDAVMTGLNVHNNIFYQNSAARSCMTIDIRNSVAANFGNNILINTAGGKLIRWTGTGTPTIAMLGNCYYSPGGFSIDWKGTNYTTFAAWQTASGLEKISGSNVGITSNPQLSSPGTAGIMGGWNSDRLAGYKPTSGSPCIAGGVDLHAQFGLTMPAVDLFGFANPASAPFACGVTAHT